MPILKPTGLLQVPGLLGGRVTTIVFDQGYSVWTCPAGVTNLLTVYGVGAEGTGPPHDLGCGDYWSVTGEITGTINDHIQHYGIHTVAIKGTPDEPYLRDPDAAWSQLQGHVDVTVDAVNAGGSGERDWTGGGSRVLYHIDPNDIATSHPQIQYVNLRNPLRIRGTATRAINAYSEHLQPIMEAGSQILYSDVISVVAPNHYNWAAPGWHVLVECVKPGAAAPDTTGFGFTFLGGQLSGSYPNSIILPPVPGSHANVAVTPGQDYAVMNRGTLIISYITP